MDHLVSSYVAGFSNALEVLAQRCRQDMKLRWPEVSFDEDVWKIHTLYGTKMLDVWFLSLISAFSEKHTDYVLAFRCLMARRALAGNVKTHKATFKAWQFLVGLSVELKLLCNHDLVNLENEIVRKSTPKSATTDLACLRILSSLLDELFRLGVAPNLAWSPSGISKSRLNALVAQNNLSVDLKKVNDTLDRKIEGLSDATNAMLRNDDRLSDMDRSAIAVANIMMCAPSRINEPLCLRYSDRFTLEEYAVRPEQDSSGKIYPIHQVLFMKGSKGADYSAKPILNFMLDLSDRCWNILIDLGTRSRSLLQHYENNPCKLYLPESIEHIRGQPVTKSLLWKIINLTPDEPTSAHLSSITGSLWVSISQRGKSQDSLAFMVDNPCQYRSNGYRNYYSVIPALPWAVVEKYLLERVHERMQAMRNVTSLWQYSGRLSDMLMLVDSDRSPFLPQAWNDKSLRSRFNAPPWRRRLNSEQTVFRKLGLKFFDGEKLVDCFLQSHDIRRWLTTKALEARERLSDVLINKWANRVDLGQIEAYDYRSEDQKAQQAALPVPLELTSITEGLKALEGIETEYGLSVEHVVVHGDSLAITSVEAVQKAIEDRPVARSSNQIIILYPNRYGMCLHQHHETPCRSYTGCSEGCNEQLTVKGHLPTNEEWRKTDELNNRSIIDQMQKLVIARNRGIADDQLMLDAHLLMLVKGVDAQAMAHELIARFHEVKDQIKDLSFRKELEAAFVARGVVSLLDDASVPPGALIKYHNPGKHASPGYERAIEAKWGSRALMESEQELFHQKYPELAPKSLGLKDERQLLDSSDDEGFCND